MARGHVASIREQVSLDFSLGGYKHSIDAYVFDIKFDLILGQNWFKMMVPIPLWGKSEWRINRDGRAYLI
jgi:hypothetical protein